MSTAINRMQFLRGDFSGRSALLRPPWALDEERFTGRCDRCGECIGACPAGILGKGRGGFPVVDFAAGECLFCADCVAVCKPGALKQADGQRPWQVHAQVDTQACIAWQGVECRSCQDPCEPRAIRMPPRLGGVSVPQIDFETCSGCGACFAVCPTGAIRMQTAPAGE